ncbi:MAG: hypothetical protein GY835_12140 [bacterium]|nr:hypothetical protein [bacterium]
MGFSISSFMSGEREQELAVTLFPQTADTCVRTPFRPTDTLRVMTLNLAHGRSNGVHQVMQSRESIIENLDATAEMIHRIDPDVVALQEADAPSAWSGRFSHVHHLARSANFKYAVQGEHVKGMSLSYGTALLSQLPLEEANSYTFPPSPPTTRKGFVVSSIPWPGLPGVMIDIVSVHFDFSRNSVRKQQVGELIDILAERDNPVIVMGDYNCNGDKDSSVLWRLASEMSLRIYRPYEEGLATFPLSGKRLDWILVSPEFRFNSYQVLPDVVSDHFAVVTELSLVAEPTRLCLVR